MLTTAPDTVVEALVPVAGFSVMTSLLIWAICVELRVNAPRSHPWRR